MTQKEIDLMQSVTAPVMKTSPLTFLGDTFIFDARYVAFMVRRTFVVCAISSWADFVLLRNLVHED